MERERPAGQSRQSHGGNGPDNDSEESLDEVRERLEGVYEAAERAFESIGPIADAEQYLQQNRQRGGQ